MNFSPQRVRPAIFRLAASKNIDTLSFAGLSNYRRFACRKQNALRWYRRVGSPSLGQTIATTSNRGFQRLSFLRCMNQLAARIRNCFFCLVTVASGVVNSSLDRVRTSTKTRSLSSNATISSSPPGQRTLRARIFMSNLRCRCSAANASPRAPRLSAVPHLFSQFHTFMNVKHIPASPIPPSLYCAGGIGGFPSNHIIFQNLLLVQPRALHDGRAAGHGSTSSCPCAHADGGL